MENILNRERIFLNLQKKRMKKFFILSIIGILLFSCSAPSGKSWKEYGLIGRVKTCVCTESSIKYINGIYLRTGNIREDTYEFNSDGLIVKSSSENTEELLNKLSKSLLYKYDENGVLQETEQFANDGTFDAKTLYIYDGNLLKEKNTYDNLNRKIHQETFAYDVNGLLLSQYVGRLLFDAKFSSKKCYRYYYKNGSLYQKKTYNAEDNALLYISHFENGKEISRKSSTGKEMSVYYNQNDLPSIVKNGMFNHNSLIMKTKGVTSYEYKYDSHGNWIEKVEFVGEGRIPMRLEQRIITYY
jgi:hypothetical protein